MRLRVLLIQEELKNYRDPIYRLIAEHVDLTVAFTTDSEITKSSYPIISLPYSKIGPIMWHKNFNKIIEKYDVIVFVPHLRMVRVATLPFFHRKQKLVTWSIGVHASYKKTYDLTKAPDTKDRIFEFIQDRADACVFYMPEPIEYWKKYKKIDPAKYFVAHNTVAVEKFDTSIERNRDTILFVGTLYQQKGIGELIECYAQAKEQVGKLPKLKIVGKGPEKELIKTLVKKCGLQDDVELTGAIYDEKILKDFFLDAIICVSPKQAGLTVLKSLGYGVPFVTRSNAISGGEKTNIINGKTGLFYDSKEELIEILSNTVKCPDKFSAMSDAAISYYRTQASPQKMAQGVIDAIIYAYNN